MNDVIGRYAPSPSGDLHVGNLRTAVIAWLCAPRGFRLRIDDIDAQRSSTTAAERQIEDLQALGLRFSGPVVRQQDSLDLYAAALRRLEEAGVVYECYCSRKDIQEAARAPHAVPGRYPGTCRGLSAAERAARRAELEAAGRVPALRLAAGVSQWSVREKFAGGVGDVFTGEVDDMVLRRSGNAGQVTSHDYAYNLAVVVDDATAGVTQVTRGDDLLSSAPRQAYVASLLGLPEVEYVHVPLVLGPTGQRLAKRDGAVTLRELVGRELAGRELAGHELAGRELAGPELAGPELAGPVSVLRWILSTVLPADKFANLRGSTAEELLDSAAEVFDLAELDPNPVTFPSE